MKKIHNFLDKYFYLVLLVFFVAAVVFMPKAYLTGDFEAYEIWAKYMMDHGLTHIYEIKLANYWPNFMYLLNGFRALFTDFTSFKDHIYYLKIPLFLFDFASVGLIGWLLGKLKRPRYLAFLVLLNPAFFYDSWIWGQIESIYIFFTLGAIIAALYRRPNLSLILYTIAFYSKLQAVIFLPGLLLILLPQFTKNPKLILSGIVSVLITHLVMLFPFILAGQLGPMYQNVMASVDYMPYITANAYNFWVLVFGSSVNRTSDQKPLLFLTYKAWGLILFCSASALVLWKQFRGWIKKPKVVPEITLEYVYNIFLITGLIAIIFYYFPTQMHERYLQPAIILIGTLVCLKPGKINTAIYLLLSGAYFLNLERYMHFLNLPARAYQLMSSQGLAAVFTVVLLLSLYLLFKEEINRLFKRKPLEAKP